MKTKSLLLSCLVCLLAAFQANAADQSCAQAIGDKRSAMLVKQCLNVSPATRPPCKAANSCEMINSEVERGCELLAGDANAPGYCTFALAKPETFQGALIAGNGTDDYTITVLLNDGRRFTAWCDGQCDAWFVAEDEGEATLRPEMVGKTVKVTVANEPNNDRIAGPSEDEMLIFVKKAELVK
ncbi:hypothetical protein KDX38_23685 [Pseudomonas sp. CDFA 602]|uniref:hypothetical protein n=1 Tax=Pseudomonas californiensis TaxID=2829823 RepID=UPI001E3D2A69|nr:hypothetical protein [Pseudomonas californiensis]MCD5996631.1 hypothetical protein [Pseudomonas californiensis]MCD6002192.1 hypothetical protein [Pseudomonas californiensis]